MKNRVFSIFFSVAFLLAGKVMGQNGIELTLKEAIEIGLKNSTIVQKIDLENQISEKQVQKNRSEFLPQIRGFANYRYFFDNQTFIFPENFAPLLAQTDGSVPVRLGTQTNINTGVNLQQRLFDRKWFTSKKQLDLFKETQNTKSEIAQEELIYNISKLFYELASNETKQNLIDFSIKRLERSGGIVKAQVEEGLVHKTVLQKIELQQSELALDKTQLNNGLNAQRKALKNLIGANDNTIFVWESSNSISQLADLSPRKSRSEKLIGLKESARQAEAENIKSDFFPKVNLEANFQYQFFNDEFALFQNNSWFTFSFIGINMDIPIFQGNKKTISLEENDLKGQLLEIEKKEAITKEKLLTDKARNDLKDAFERHDLLKKRVILKKRLYEINLLQYEEGILGINELLQSETELLQSEQNLEEGFLDLKLKELEYLKSIGQLSYVLN